MSDIETTLANIPQVNQSNWRQMLLGRGVKFLLFYSKQCPYCKKFAPVFVEASKKYVTITFLRTNVEQLADRFDIDGFPTTLILEDGNEVNIVDGTMDAYRFNLVVREYAGEEAAKVTWTPIVLNGKKA